MANGAALAVDLLHLPGKPAGVEEGYRTSRSSPELEPRFSRYPLFALDLLQFRLPICSQEYFPAYLGDLCCVRRIARCASQGPLCMLPRLCGSTTARPTSAICSVVLTATATPSSTKPSATCPTCH